MTTPIEGLRARAGRGTVHSVTIKSYALTSGLLQTILIQVLRPQPNGSLLVVETSQSFTLPTTAGTYTFAPTNMTVQPGDFIGIATLGGKFMIATSASGALTDDFSGHQEDMNGDELRTTKEENGVELLGQVDVVEQAKEEKSPPSPLPPPSPPPRKPCKCGAISVELAPTLLKRRLSSARHCVRRRLRMAHDMHRRRRRLRRHARIQGAEDQGRSAVEQERAEAEPGETPTEVTGEWQTDSSVVIGAGPCVGPPVAPRTNQNWRATLAIPNAVTAQSMLARGATQTLGKASVVCLAIVS